MKISFNSLYSNKIFKRAAIGMVGVTALATVGGCTFDNMLVKDSESMPRYNKPFFAPVVGVGDSSGSYTEVFSGWDKEPMPVVGIQFSH